ncbi:hypothetical protein JVT61DRAFT_7430 [Boletus reticuloceps]|uniref:Uncharacterized protein n=1 Tax=Boletus reticuloceps TaxID=495285 RepID=A0A8I2YIE3_9AGAM|nr:hypothetical protein JVT61DRAFT_7430 [Boletus reticuloceps]
MVHRPLQNQDDDDVLSDKGPDSDPTTDEDSEASDAEEILSALHVLAADTDITELRKVLSLCQKALTDACGKLGVAKKDVRTLSTALPLRKRQGIMNKTELLKEDIGRVVKKFAILYRLWVIDGLFPILSVNNPDIDLQSATRWDSNKAKSNAVLTELFMVMPQLLHKDMLKYKSFGSVFTATLNQERSNMLCVVKEVSPLVFAALKVPDATIFTLSARKRDDPEMK